MKKVFQRRKVKFRVEVRINRRPGAADFKADSPSSKTSHWRSASGVRNSVPVDSHQSMHPQKKTTYNKFCIDVTFEMRTVLS
jgi:hypothetical protein